VLGANHDLHYINHRVVDESFDGATQDRCAAKRPVLLWWAFTRAHAVSGSDDQSYDVWAGGHALTMRFCAAESSSRANAACAKSFLPLGAQSFSLIGN
jgi:hypothetical protein